MDERVGREEMEHTIDDEVDAGEPSEMEEMERTLSTQENEANTLIDTLTAAVSEKEDKIADLEANLRATYRETDILQRRICDAEKNEEDERKRKERIVQAIDRGMSGKDLKDAISARTEWNSMENTIVVGVDNTLHIDGECGCGQRQFGEMYTDEHIGNLGQLSFTTVRELAYLMEMRSPDDMGEELLNLHNEYQRKVAAKEPPAANALRKAYRKAYCSHRKEKVDEIAGDGSLRLEGEDDSMGDIATEVLMSLKNGDARTYSLILLPIESTVSKSEGTWRHLKQKRYDGAGAECVEILQEMDRKKSYPKVLYVIIATVWPKDTVVSVLQNAYHLAKTHCVTVYVVMDQVNINNGDHLDKAATETQKCLTEFALATDHQPNLVVATQLNMLINGIIPISCLYQFIGREDLPLLEELLCSMGKGEKLELN